jgi:hypothetical protein
LNIHLEKELLNFSEVEQGNEFSNQFAFANAAIADCDNDGKNEINAGNVDVNSGQNFTEWVFKYGLTP